MAKAAGNKRLARQCDDRIKDYREAYDKMCDGVGLEKHYERMGVFEGNVLTSTSLGGRLQSSENDFRIFKGIGAKAKNYDIKDLLTCESFHFAEGTKIQNTEVFAGKGSKHEYRIAYKYANRYGGAIEDWQHVKGIGIIDYYGENRKANIHWSQCKDIGKFDFFVKEWIE